MQKIEDDDDQIARDGQTIRVPLMLMDSVQKAVASSTVTNDGAGHRPGYAVITDAMVKDRLKLYDAYIARVTSAWKNPPAVLANATDGKAPPPHKPATDDRAKLCDAYDKKLSERWRGTVAA